MIKLAFSYIASINRYNFLEGNSATHFESLKYTYSFILVILHLGFYLMVIIIVAHKDLCTRVLIVIMFR